MSFKNKNVVVTGGAKGIGGSCSKVFHELGANVCILDIDEKGKEFANDLGGKSFFVQCDVSKQNQVTKAFAQIVEQMGDIDVLVNNAGIQIRGPLEDFKLEDWNKLLSINLTGAFLVSKSVVKNMIEKRAGKIINICSIQSDLARPSITPYTASKGGVRNLTRGMATDWGKHNIQINGIAPGYFKTEMTKALYEDETFDAWLCNRTPADRWGNPEELVGSLIFLSSEASNYVNGHLVYVDGGMRSCV